MLKNTTGNKITIAATVRGPLNKIKAMNNGHQAINRAIGRISRVYIRWRFIWKCIVPPYQRDSLDCIGFTRERYQENQPLFTAMARRLAKEFHKALMPFVRPNTRSFLVRYAQQAYAEISRLSER